MLISASRMTMRRISLNTAHKSGVQNSAVNVSALNGLVFKGYAAKKRYLAIFTRWALSNVYGAALSTFAIRASIARTNPDPAEIDDVLIGCAYPKGANGSNGARQSILKAGLPGSSPGFTLERKCPSGLQTFVLAAQRIRAGEDGINIAPGVDSVPLVQPSMDHTPSQNSGITEISLSPARYFPLLRHRLPQSGCNGH